MPASRFRLDELELPIVQAPLAGGPSTPALAGAVANAGGLGFLAGGYKPVDAVESDVKELRGLTDRPFGVNLFVPTEPSQDAQALRRYADALGEDASRYGTTAGEPRHDDDAYEAKLELLERERVPVVSFTFGSPTPDVVQRLHGAGVAVWVGVTKPAEATAARDAGADAVVVQGVEAGGHRATFDDAAPGDIGLLALLQLVRASVDLPMVAAGGIMTGRGIAAVLAGGASAAQLGSALMLTPEAATLPPHRAAFGSDAGTGLTRAFSGRTARGIVNRFMRDHPDAPSAFPEVGAMVAPVRAAAREAGDPEAMNLFAGQAYRLAVAAPAGELVRQLAADAAAALEESAASLRGVRAGQSPAG